MNGFDALEQYPALRPLVGKTWLIAENITYEGNRDTWVLPEGSLTDLASVPSVLWWGIGPYGAHLRAALIHDHLCKLAKAGKFKREDADGVFRRELKLSNVRFFQRNLMWAAVRLANPSILKNKTQLLAALAIFLPSMVLMLPALLPVLVIKTVARVINALGPR